MAGPWQVKRHIYAARSWTAAELLQVFRTSHCRSVCNRPSNAQYALNIIDGGCGTALFQFMEQELLDLQHLCVYTQPSMDCKPLRDMQSSL